VFIAIGGLPVVLAMMHLSNLMPELAGTVITIMNVMIDVSALNFQVRPQPRAQPRTRTRTRACR
jgi:hypothetical protein